MYYVYILKSSVDGNLYIGLTENLEKRLEIHNAGKVRSTKARRPFTLLDFEEYPSRSEAFRREIFLKTGQQREILKKRFQ